MSAAIVYSSIYGRRCSSYLHFVYISAGLCPRYAAHHMMPRFHSPCFVLSARLLCLMLLATWQWRAQAQQCPPNIDFEKGTLDGWRCYIGNVLDQGGTNVFSLTESGGAVDGRHTIIPAAGAGNDPFGGFPMRSPNGSDYCVRLGNNTGGGEGEAITYEFSIPANRKTYSLLYYYAVVFEGPNHQQQQQPRMEIEVKNLTKDAVIDCASFAFIPFGTTLPGFFESSVVQSNSPVFCKDWTPVTINLDGNAGNTIRLTFRTGDCTFRRHFGYAYIDVASDCSGEFTGASFCAADKEVTVSAPFGFQTYTWFNADMTRQIGTGQSITLRPPPPPGTVLQVRLVPYDGFGCPQTLTARLQDNLDFAADAGHDTLSCNLAPVRLGTPGRPGLRYQWSPVAGLSNAQAANPIATPANTTQYVLTVSSPGGGCVSTDTVRVIASNLTNSMELLGAAQYCMGSADSAVLQVGAVASIQWYRNGQVLAGQTQRQYRPANTGVYHAFLKDEYGCSDSTARQPIDISSIPQAGLQIPQAAQCLAGNQFTFSSTSTNAVGAMQYQWWLDGQPASQTDASWVHQFGTAGAHTVKLVVRSNAVCADSVQADLMLYQNPVPKFDAVAACIQQPFVPVNQTDEQIGSPIRYSWLVDDQPYSNLRQPPAQVFTQGGAHRITLTVSSQQCPTPLQKLTKSIQVERPAAPRRYPAMFAIRQVPLQLEARSVGVQAKWQPAVQLNDDRSYRPVFKGTQSQDYAIVLTSRGGCVTVDSVLVEIVQRANIEVPSAFTPNGDGRNDELKPVPMGIAEIRYFRVFNRWGQLLYESRQSRTGWDGAHKGQLLATQTVVWMVEGVGLDGTVITKKGTAVLIR